MRRRNGRLRCQHVVLWKTNWNGCVLIALGWPYSVVWRRLLERRIPSAVDNNCAHLGVNLSVQLHQPIILTDELEKINWMLVLTTCTPKIASLHSNLLLIHSSFYYSGSVSLLYDSSPGFLAQNGAFSVSVCMSIYFVSLHRSVCQSINLSGSVCPLC